MAYELVMQVVPLHAYIFDAAYPKHLSKLKAYDEHSCLVLQLFCWSGWGLTLRTKYPQRWCAGMSRKGFYIATLNLPRLHENDITEPF